VDRSHTVAACLAHAADLLRRGQEHEAQGEFTSAIAGYESVIVALRALPLADDEVQRSLGVAWMNRGNALQKLAASDATESRRQSEAAASYDEAIHLFVTLPPGIAAYRNHLGAAWLNRGHAFIGVNDAEAARCFNEAIAALVELPHGENAAYRLNLAGAWTNLAHVEIANAPGHARAAAAAALKLVTEAATSDLTCAEMSLRARRALAMSLGELLRAADVRGEPIDALAAEASDALEEGLVLARSWETRAVAQLRPLALRLFRLGAQIYRVHQPHFLAEYLLEQLAPRAFAEDSGFCAAAAESLAQALADTQRPQLLVAGTPAAEKALATVHSLRAAQAHLLQLNAIGSPVSA
jgi:hypothetical protein